MKRFACVAAVCLVALLGVGVALGSRAGAAAARRSEDVRGVQLRPDAGPQVGRVLRRRGRLPRDAGARSLRRKQPHEQRGDDGTGRSRHDHRELSRRHGLHGVQGEHRRRRRALQFRCARRSALRARRRRRRERDDRSRVHRERRGVDPATRPDVQLGGDLSGSTNKTIFVFGFGVNMPFKSASSATSAIATVRSSRRPTTRASSPFPRSASCSASASASSGQLVMRDGSDAAGTLRQHDRRRHAAVGQRGRRSASSSRFATSAASI